MPVKGGVSFLYYICSVTSLVGMLHESSVASAQADSWLTAASQLILSLAGDQLAGS
jgi:hypothetical protein